MQKNNKQFTYGQTVQKNNNNLHMDRQCKKTTTTIYIWTDSAKKQQTIYIWTDSAKKTTNNLHMDRQCKKNCTGAFTVLQTVQKNQQQFTYGQTVQKKQQTIYIWTDSARKQQTIYIWTDSAKKTTNNLHMDRQCKKKLHWSIYSAPDSAKKTTTIYIWTDSAKKTTNNLHMDRQCNKTTNNLHMDRQCKKKLHWSIYSAPDSAKKTTTIYIWTVHIYRLYRRQCAKYTYIYSVHIVYYKDTLNYQRHITEYSEFCLLMNWKIVPKPVCTYPVVCVCVCVCVCVYTELHKYSNVYCTMLFQTFTFTFMHLADAFIQSDLQLHSGYTFSLVHVFPGNRTHNLLRSWRNALPLSHTGTKTCFCWCSVSCMYHVYTSPCVVKWANCCAVFLSHGINEITGLI